MQTVIFSSIGAKCWCDENPRLRSLVPKSCPGLFFHLGVDYSIGQFTGIFQGNFLKGLFKGRFDRYG